MADSVETLGVDLRTRVKRFGVKARRKKSEILRLTRRTRLSKRTT